ncbi:MAG: ABC transporter substrate-binding protein [Chloroflexi bacterium]|nr:ABC transporter substrate-binding protein [Chloroflexota bacterium]
MIGLAVVVLAACAPATPSSTPAPTATPAPAATTAPSARTVTLQFWTVLPAGSTTDKELDALLRAFQLDYPDIRIVVSSQPTATELYRRVVASVAAGTLPDLVAGGDADIAQYARIKALAPLDDFIGGANGLSTAELADILPALQETLKPGDPDNKVYSLPFARGVVGLYYNWSAMKAIGITNTPRTWDEFRLHARTLTRSPVRGFAYRSEATVFEAMLLSRGGSFYDAKLSKATFNAPAGVDALAYLGDGVKEGWIYRAATPADLNDFAAGRAMFTIASTTLIPAYQQAIDAAAAKGGKTFEWGVAALPQAEGKKPTLILDGSNIAMMRGTPDKMQAAWTFMRWLMSPKAAAAWTQASGALPARAAARDLLKDYFVKVPAQKQALDELSPVAHPGPVVRASAEVRQLAEGAIAAFESGKTAPNVALDDAAAKATVLLNAK